MHFVYFRMKKVFIVQMISLLLSVGLAVPKRYPGLSWGADNYEVMLEMFCDPLCSDCAYSFPTMMKLVNKFPTLKFVLHLMPLASHTWSYHAAKAVHAMRSFSEDKAKDMITKLYNGDQAMFSNGACANLTESGVIDKLAHYAADNFNVDYTEYKNQYANPSTRSLASGDLTLSIKHSILATPTYEINGAASDFDESTSYDEWVEYFEGIFNE